MSNRIFDTYNWYYSILVPVNYVKFGTSNNFDSDFYEYFLCVLILILITFYLKNVAKQLSSLNFFVFRIISKFSLNIFVLPRAWYDHEPSTRFKNIISV